MMDRAAMPDDVDITPTLVPYKYGGCREVCVQLTNKPTLLVQ